MKPTSNLIGYFVVIILTFLTTSLYISCDKPILEEETVSSKITTKRPEKIISLQQAIDMYDEYSMKRVPYIEEVEGTDTDGHPFMATRSLFFEYDQLKRYLDFIEHEISKRDTKITGVRFYFSKYPEDRYPNADAEVKYPKRQTFFIAPTVSKKVDGQEFNPGVTIGRDDKIIFLADVLKGKRKGLGSNTETNNINEASITSFFNLNMAQGLGNSLIANELNGSPPNADEPH